MSKNSFANMPAGRPSQASSDRAKLLASLQDTARAEPSKRVNFELAESLHIKLKIHATRQGQSIKDFLTSYIETLPEI
jgi:predicted HicB family RNase H-like nuclease